MIFDSHDICRNCLLAFTLAEQELGIPQLLDIDYVVRSESPDQFFIMTYVAQFYHKFTLPDSGYDSTFTTSFKCSSSEEEAHHHHQSGARRQEKQERCVSCEKRRSPVTLQYSEIKRQRPIGLGRFIEVNWQ